MAVVLWEHGLLDTPWLVNLDADTQLPADYFLRVTAPRGTSVVPRLEKPGGPDMQKLAVL